ncbi:YihY/virulence factor BrkB family protein [Polaromonas sp.]|nr:YihY/virulence factor BrkB family protein [Candidatus Saccharibacteria bacterium]
MNILQKTIAAVDTWQRRHPFTSFPYAVVKKYGEDEAGYQAALLTYYGFLSLFPLLLVVTTVVTMLGGQHAALQQTVTMAVSNYFPAFGDQLSKVQTIHKSGVALVVGILFTLYGARGVADAFRNGVNHIWQTPRAERVGFPMSIVKSLSIIAVGGIGFMLASISTGVAAGVGHGFLFRVLSIAVNLFILFWLFRILLNLALPGKVPFRQTRSGAAAAAVGIVTLQFVGGLILTRELKNLNAVYSIFALSLGLLFWIYLQAQTIYYAVEIASVRSLKLYPRGMREDALTPADKRVMTRQARRERQIDAEAIDTKFG